MQKQQNFDFLIYCRICAENKSGLRNLFDVKHKEITLSEMISFCTQLIVQPHDNRPSTICAKCFEKLEIAYEFCSLAKSSEEKFQRMISSQSQQSTPSDPLQSIESVLVKHEDENDTLCVINGVENQLKVEIKEESDADEVQPLDVVTVCLPEKTVKRRTKSSSKPTSAPPPTSYKNNNTKLKRFECYKCKLKSRSVRFIQIHMKVHHDATPHQCSICGMHFSKEHFDRHLCKGRTIQCEYCTESFKTTLSLLEHLKQHKNQLVITSCSHCKMLAPMKILFEFHTRHHHKAKAYRCEVFGCDRSFDVRTALHKHRYMHKKEKREKTFLCAECGSSFLSVNQLERHQLSAHAEVRKVDRPFACPKCPSRFTKKFSLKIHMSTHEHTTFRCDVCGSMLTTLSSLQIHKRTVHLKVSERACEICSQSCKTASSLKRHMLIHTGEKPYKCSYCDRAYRQKGDLNKHLRTHLGDNLYQCTFNACSQSFRLYTELRKHLYEHYENQASLNINTNDDQSTSNK